MRQYEVDHASLLDKSIAEFRLKSADQGRTERETNDAI